MKIVINIRKLRQLIIIKKTHIKLKNLIQNNIKLLALVYRLDNVKTTNSHFNFLNMYNIEIKQIRPIAVE